MHAQLVRDMFGQRSGAVQDRQAVHAPRPRPPFFFFPFSLFPLRCMVRIPQYFLMCLSFVEWLQTAFINVIEDRTCAVPTDIDTTEPVPCLLTLTQQNTCRAY